MRPQAGVPSPGKCLLLCSDGGLEAVIDRAGGWVEAARPADVYSTDEPRAAYHARIAFCMDIHTEVRSWLAHGRMGRMGGAAWAAWAGLHAPPDGVCQ